MNYIGVDYSMTSPSWSIINDKITSYFLTTKSKMLGETKINDDFVVIGLEYPDYKHDTERFHKLAKIACDNIPKDNTKIAIEGYSFGSTGSRTFQIGENCGVLKNMLMLNGYEFTTYAPTEVKFFGFGKGNAKKNQMFEAFIKQTGFDENFIRQTFNQQGEIKSPLADIIDSYFIANLLKHNDIVINLKNQLIST